MDSFRAVDPSRGFLVSVVARKEPDTSGYFIAKGDPFGRRYFSLFSSAFSRQLVLYYSTATSGQEAVSWGYSTNDDAIHHYILSVKGAQAILTVDGVSLGERTLSGLIVDCDPSSSCVLLLGMRPPANFALTGTVWDARIVYDTAA